MGRFSINLFQHPVMPRSWSIKQLFNLVLAVLLVPPFLLLAYSIKQRHQDQIESMHARSLTLVRTSAQDAVFLLSNARYVLTGLIQRPLIQSLDPQRCDPILREVRQWYSEFANLSTIDRSGQVICNASSEPGQKLPNYSKREWFGRVFTSRSFVIGAPVVGGTTKIWISPLVQPIVDHAGNMTGVLSMTINLAQFKPRFARQEFPAGTEVSIVNSSGVFIAHSADTDAETWLGRRFPEPKLVAAALEHQHDAATSLDYLADNNIDYVAAFMHVPGTDWHVIATIPTQAVTTGARQAAFLNLAAVALVLTAALGMATLVLRNISRSISSIVDTAIAHICRSVTARASETGPREIATLARQINLMLDARDRSEARIAYLAHHDLLTGLANRAAFLEKSEEASARLRVRGETFTIMLLDLDRFKDVNDTFGHPLGDKLLSRVAQRLKPLLKETDVLARLGGDEFGIIQSGELQQSASAATTAATIAEALSEPFEFDGLKIVVEASIGIAQAPADGVAPDDLLKKADLALYHQKSIGRNGHRFYDPSMTLRADMLHQLANDLRTATANDQLDVHYQLVIDAKTRKPSGAEALVRWQHPQRGLLSPGEFISLAEESGLIDLIGKTVLQRACNDAVKWPPSIRVAVNLSPLQFKSKNLFEDIRGALAASGLPPTRLELEITESILIENYEMVMPIIQKLKALGVTIALDDFGTGYSSLVYLTTLPFDKIKIDKSFTEGIMRRSECAAIVASVLTLGQSLGISTTAEGVETEEQFNMLRTAGVTLVQGYLFGRPRPAAQLDFGGLSEPNIYRAA